MRQLNHMVGGALHEPGHTVIHDVLADGEEHNERALLALRRTIAQGELVNLRRTDLGTG